MANLDQLAEDLSSLTVLEAAELAKLLEEKWGVSAAAAVAVAAPAGGAAGGGAAQPRGPASFAVPTEAVRDNRVFVFDPARGRAHAIAVTIVGQDGGQTVVRGELSPTQRVILVAVEDGERVEVRS